MQKPLNFLYNYYTKVAPNHRVLELCGVTGPDTPYNSYCDEDLTVIINAYGRPDYLPLIWEAIQYQTRRPRETWIVQNNPQGRATVPRAFFESVRQTDGTVIIDTGINHGCWFRFFLAALSCRTRYVAIYDDDTLSAREALATALDDMSHSPGIYGGTGVILCWNSEGPRYQYCEASGWPAGSETVNRVDFAGHLWLMETYWLKELFKHVPDRLFVASDFAREGGEDMYVSYVAQKLGIPTYTYRHGNGCNEKWSSIQAFEMGFHPNAMSSFGGLIQSDYYLRYYIANGWKLLRFSD